MKRIFVCSPYRASADQSLYENIKYARLACQAVVSAGHNPFAPHLFYTEFLNDDIPFEREKGIELGKNMLEFCDEVWVFTPRGKESEGMLHEISHAVQRGIPVKWVCAPCSEMVRGQTLVLHPNLEQSCPA